jgi:hypothetical protein
MKLGFCLCRPPPMHGGRMTQDLGSYGSESEPPAPLWHLATIWDLEHIQLMACCLHVVLLMSAPEEG